MSIELKIKAKALAAEMRIIRKEEHRLLDAAHRGELKLTRAERRLFAKAANVETPGLNPDELKRLSKARERLRLNREPYNCSVARDTRERLRHHRVVDLRPEARATNLARAFLKGRTYLSVEGKTHHLSSDVLFSAARMVKKYGDHDFDTTLRAMDILIEWTEGRALVVPGPGSMPKLAGEDS